MLRIVSCTLKKGDAIDGSDAKVSEQFTIPCDEERHDKEEGEEEDVEG